MTKDAAISWSIERNRTKDEGSQSRRNTGQQLIQVAVLISLMVSPLRAVVLYDATMGTTPNEQGWVALSNPLAAQATHHIEQGTLILNTLESLTEQAGYFSKIPALSVAHPGVPTIDLNESTYAVDFSIRIVNSVDLPDDDLRHTGERNRGGFGIIAISQDLTGIELQFQHDYIVALDAVDTAFPIGERAATNTTVSLRDYRLILSPDGYRVTVDEQALLWGLLRNYTNVAPKPPLDFPYTTPSFFFFGDDTPRGGAITELARFAVAPLGDCTHDGQRNQADFICFSSWEERDAVLEVMNSPIGDLDGDGQVAFLDFLLLSGNFGNPEANYSEGNIDLLNGVDFGDFLLLSSNFSGHDAGIENLPETSMSIDFILPWILITFLRHQKKTPRIEPRRFAN